MASAAAKKFFNSHSAADQAAIKASWGGADLMDEWFNNAKKAGSVPASGRASSASTFTGQAPTEITAENRQTADMTPQERAAWAAQNINSFDAAAGYSNGGRTPEQAQAQWLAWDDKYDASCPPNTPYRGRAGQCAESPDNCPEGTTLHGSSCVDPKSLPAEFGGQGPGAQGAGAGAAPQGQGAAYFGQDDPLQRHLVGLLENSAGSFTGAAKGGQLAGGGVWSQPGSFPGTSITSPAPAASPIASAAAGIVGQGFGGRRPTEASQGNGSITPFAGISNPSGYNAGSAALNAFAPKATAGAAAHGQPTGAPMTAQPFAQPRGGTLEDMINPERRRPRDARTGGSWF